MAGKATGKPPAAAKAPKKSARKAAGKAASARKRTAARKPRKITPGKALDNTRKLLEAKHTHDRQSHSWEQLDGSHAATPQSGFQSPEAAANAEQLHAGESRMQAIQGSISTHDRHNQGRRDKG